MLHKLPLWMHFKTEYQTFSNLVRDDLYRIAYCYTPGNMLGGDLGEVVSLQEQTSPYFQLREKSKCIEYIGKAKFRSKTSP